MKRILLAIFASVLMSAPVWSADDFYEAQLNNGIRNSDVASYMLIYQAQAEKSQSEALLKKAVQYSPDLPAVYFELAKSRMSFRYTDMLQVVDYVISGINAYGRNFWWAFSLAGSAFLSLVFSFVFTILIIALIRGIQDLPLVSHELGESKQNIALLIAFVVMSAISPLLLLAGLLVLIGMYMSKIDKVVVYAYFVFLIASPAIFSAADRFVAVPSSGAVRAVVEVNEAKGNAYALAFLKSSDNQAEKFSYALALKRAGLFEESIRSYEALLKNDQNAAAYVNIGNAYAGLNRNEDAIKNYQAAVNIYPLASAYYNLSQISREIFDFEKGSEYFDKAVEIDRNAVMIYRSYSERNPNRLVADEPMNNSELWRYAWNNSPSKISPGLSILPLWVLTAVSLMLMVAFYLLCRHARNKAYRCRRCQSIFCPQCEKHIMWGQMCPQCFRSIVKMDESEVRERVARLLTIYEHQKRRRDIMRWLSFIIPGSAQVYGGKVLYGLMFIWPFMFLVTFPIAAYAMPPDPYGTHWFMSAVSLAMAAILLVLSNIFTRQRISKGWL